MIQPVKVEILLNSKNYKKESLDLLKPLKYLREFLKLPQNHRFISPFGLIDPVEECSILTKEVLFPSGEIRLQSYISYGSEPNMNTLDHGISEETKEHPDDDLTISDSSYASCLEESESNVDVPMQGLGNNKSSGSHVTVPGKKIPDTIDPLDPQQGRKKQPLFKVIKREALNSELLNIPRFPPALPRLVTTEDITEWYQTLRLKKIYYEHDRCRFHRTKVIHKEKKPKKVRIFLNIGDIIGKVFTDQLDLLYDFIKTYYAIDYNKSQTRYLIYLEGEFMLNQDKP
jgi:hypothetical protein